MKTGEIKCSKPYCGRRAADGHAIYRISPKGEPFVGLCVACYYDRLTKPRGKL